MDECGKGGAPFFFISFFLIITIIIMILFHLNSLGCFFVSSPLSSEFVFYSNGLRRASNHGSLSQCGHNNRPTHQQRLIAEAGQSEPTVFFSLFPTLQEEKKNPSFFHSFPNRSMISVLLLLLTTEVETSLSLLFISMSIIFY